MAGRGIHPVRLELTLEERTTLGRWVRRGSTAQALALRARVVLACANRSEVAHGVLAAEVGVPRAAVGRWRKRSAAGRLAGLKDDPRVGAPRRISDADVERAIAATLEQAAGRDALEYARAGAGGRAESLDGRAHLARLRPRAAPECGVQALDWPGALRCKAAGPTRCSWRRSATSWAATSTTPPRTRRS